jgi:hypothetical protein
LLRFPGINEIVGVLLLKVRSCNWNFGEKKKKKKAGKEKGSFFCFWWWLLAGNFKEELEEKFCSSRREKRVFR